MNSYMIVASFKDGVTPEQIRELIPAEMARAKELKEQGLLGEIKVAMSRRTVFIEAFSDNEEAVTKVVESLPLTKVWDFEVFLTTPPAGPAF